MDAFEEEVLQRLWSEFEATGQWPTVDDLVSEFDDKGMDFEAAARATSGIAQERIGEVERARLSADAILRLAQGQTLFAPLPTLLELARNRFIERGPVYIDEVNQVRVTEADFRLIWGDPTSTERVVRIITDNSWRFPFSGRGGQAGEMWFQPSLEVLRFEGVATLDDYLRVVAASRSAIGQYPSGKHLDVLRRIYRHAMGTGDWPGALQFVFDHRDIGDVPQLLGELADFVPHVQLEQRHSQLTLNERSIQFIDDTGELKANLFASLRCLAKVWRAERTSTIVPVARIASLAGLDPKVLAPQLRLLAQGVFRGTPTDKDGVLLGVIVDRSILKFKAVNTLDEYLAIRGLDQASTRQWQTLSSGSLDERPPTGEARPPDLKLELRFMKSDRLRRAVESDLREVGGAAHAEAYRAALILLGSALEAILFDILDRRPVIAASYLKGRKWPEAASIRTMLEALRDQGLLDPAAAAAVQSVKDYRDLVHPWRRISENLQIDGETVEIVWNHVVAVVKSLRNAAETGRLTAFEMS